MDIKNLTDAELQARHAESRDEITRRARMAAIPEQVRELVDEWIEDGQNVDVLVAVLTEPDTPT